MSYFVVCLFDLKDATYEDYVNAYSDLAKIGFSKVLTSNEGKKITLPTTTTAGEFNGVNSDAVADDLIARVRSSFALRGFRSEIFLSVGNDWRWRHHTT